MDKQYQIFDETVKREDQFDEMTVFKNGVEHFIDFPGGPLISGIKYDALRFENFDDFITEIVGYAKDEGVRLLYPMLTEDTLRTFGTTIWMQRKAGVKVCV